MAIRAGNTALTPVMLPLALGVTDMTDERFQDEAQYQASLSVARTMLRKGLISKEEFDMVDDFLLEKYNPPLGALFAHRR